MIPQSRTRIDILDPASLIRPDLFDMLVTEIAEEHNTPTHYATRILDQALGFLVTCAANPAVQLGPSAEVDKGWHAFLEHPEEYAEFCQRIAGRHINHRPEESPLTGAAAVERLGMTIKAMRAAGVPVDSDLWFQTPECSQCYAGCVDDPKGGGEG